MIKSALILMVFCTAPAWSYAVLPQVPQTKSSGLRIYSPAFLENDYIPGKYTCDGDNVSPPLHISGVTNKARSLVLIMTDPDALAGDWVHWTVWNMDVSTKVISENSIPDGSVEGDTDYEMPAWTGPCPRWGVHRYKFQLFALDIKLDLTVRAGKIELDKAMLGHVLDQTDLTGFYGRAPERAATENWIQRKFTN